MRDGDRRVQWWFRQRDCGDGGASCGGRVDGPRSFEVHAVVVVA